MDELIYIWLTFGRVLPGPGSQFGPVGGTDQPHPPHRPTQPGGHNTFENCNLLVTGKGHFTVHIAISLRLSGENVKTRDVN